MQSEELLSSLSKEENKIALLNQKLKLWRLLTSFFAVSVIILLILSAFFTHSQNTVQSKIQIEQPLRLEACSTIQLNNTNLT